MIEITTKRCFSPIIELRLDYYLKVLLLGQYLKPKSILPIILFFTFTEPGFTHCNPDINQIPKYYLCHMYHAVFLKKMNVLIL